MTAGDVAAGDAALAAALAATWQRAESSLQDKRADTEHAHVHVNGAVPQRPRPRASTGAETEADGSEEEDAPGPSTRGVRRGAQEAGERKVEPGQEWWKKEPRRLANGKYDFGRFRCVEKC